ncbi:MAG: HipA N-terminal domain-containing protein [Planctomycetota bacterium]|jgi:serine/threonine-protein kinase HipA
MKRRANILFFMERVGELSEDENGYRFQYTPPYVRKENPTAISLTLPVQPDAFHSEHLFPFFDGLIPEGWLLDLATESWKINPRDRMGLLLACCRECIGAVSVVPAGEES